MRWTEPNRQRPFKVWWPVAAFFMAGQAFQLVAPYIRPPGGVGDTSLPYWLHAVVATAAMLLGVIYWVLWRVVWPKLGGYKLSLKEEHLNDGTTVRVHYREPIGMEVE